MKKFLSLVLALVMTMSLVTISAGAKDFTDDGKINYEEAVDVMSAVGVIDGYEDGSFNPQGGLTRGAAAKIICNLILGPTTAAALSADTAPYKDVPVDSTFAGYIAYCAKEGIISGYADGTFRPAAPLTGYAFMKMLLGALGYDAEVEGYTGANWSINVAKRALNIKLNKGLEGEFVGTKAVNREEAALYAFNTLTATMVEYKNSSTIVVGDITVKASSEASKREWMGTQGGGYITNAGANDGYLQFCEEYFTNLKKTNVAYDDFGRPAHTWKVKKTTVGTYNNTPDAVYTSAVKGKAIYADLGASYDMATVNPYFVDGVETDVPTDDDDVALAAKKSNGVEIGANGTLVEVYVMEDAVVDGNDTEDGIRVVVINTYVAQVDSDYDKDDEELEITVLTEDAPIEDATLKLDDLANIKDFKEDDMVLITIASDDTTADGQYVASIELVEATTAAVTEYESNYEANTHTFAPKDTVTAGGETYKYNGVGFATGIENFAGEYDIKADYDFYLDNYGYVIYVEGVSVEDKYVYVDAFEASGISTKATAKAYAYFTDGTSDPIDVSEITLHDAEEDEDVTIKLKGRDVITAALSGLNGLFTYTEKNGKYKLTYVETNGVEMVGAHELDEGTVVLADELDFADVRGSKNTVFIVIDEDDETEVYTGIKNVPEIVIEAADENDDLAFIAFSDDDSSLYAKYVFIDLGDVGSTSGRVKGGDVMFLYEGEYAKKGMDSDENVYYTYKVIKDGKLTTVKFNDDDGNEALAQGLYTGVKYDENGYACKAELVDDMEGTKGYTFDDTFAGGYIEKKGDVITVWYDNGANKSDGYYMTDDCTVKFIVDDEVKDVSWKKVAEGADYTVSAIWGAMNSDDEYTDLFILVTEAE